MIDASINLVAFQICLLAASDQRLVLNLAVLAVPCIYLYMASYTVLGNLLPSVMAMAAIT